MLAGAMGEGFAGVDKKKKKPGKDDASSAAKVAGDERAERASKMAGGSLTPRPKTPAAEPEPEPDAEAEEVVVEKSEDDKISLKDMGVSFKRQHNAPRYRKFPGTVGQLLERTINAALGDRRFRLLVMRPMRIESLEDLKVTSLSGGELQRVAICVCLGTPAHVYLLDEPSAGLDVEQRVIVAKVIKRWIVTHLHKTAFIVEHDFVMATALAERVIVFDGERHILSTCSLRS